jgi:septum formation protein
MDVLLASTSPRRAALLRQLGLEIDIAAPDVDESHIAGESPAAYVTRLSRMKWAVAVTGLPAVAADTAVIIGGMILGKPESREHAACMLGWLAGETHEVVSGVTVGVPGGSAETFSVKTRVTMRSVSPHEIDQYWDTGEPADKAGAYGIQGLGALFVRRIEGSYTNVVGLPLSETAVALAGCGVDCFALNAKRRGR